MRILQISSARTFGGGERHVVDLARGLQDRGHEIFAAVRPTCQWLERLSFLDEERILRVSIRNSIGVFSAMRMADFVRENDIQIVHAHVARDYIPASIACMAAKGSRFIFTRHLVFPLKPFNRFALKNLSAAIGVSDAVGVELRRLFHYDKVRIIPNGIDMEHFDLTDPETAGRDFRSMHGIPKDAPLIGTLGELKELKGQRDLVLAAAEIAKSAPDARFVIVGLDNSLDKKFRRELRRLVSVLGLEASFLWLDWLDDTAPFFSAIDVFVSPSHSESFGLAILEAMARNKAIVATETDGAKMLVDGTGTLVPISDPVAMATAVVAVLGDAEQRQRMGRSAREKAAEKYSLSRMIDATEELYREVLQTGDAAG
jgi:glycosyltransferase involved in cell wall biosynthesis